MRMAIRGAATTPLMIAGKEQCGDRIKGKEVHRKADDHGRNKHAVKRFRRQRLLLAARWANALLHLLHRPPIRQAREEKEGLSQ